MDGRFLEAKPVEPRELDPPINDIEASTPYDDANGTLRRRINTELAQHELLFDRRDDLVTLHALKLHHIYRGRQAQGASRDGTTAKRLVPAPLRRLE